MVAKRGFSPPEQTVSSGRIGPWTDVYATCATIYYCMTGKLVPEAMERMLGTPLYFPDQFSEKLSAVLTHGLALLPQDRIQSMGELRRALELTGAEPEPMPEIYNQKKTKKSLELQLKKSAAHDTPSAILKYELREDYVEITGYVGEPDSIVIPST